MLEVPQTHEVSPPAARAGQVVPCAVCSGPVPAGRREACSGRCRAVLSRERRQARRHHRDEELLALLRRALRLLEE